MATLQLTQNVTFEGEEMSSGFLSSGWYYANQTLLLGILLAITGNFLISISLTVQKSSHLLLARQADQKSYYKSKLWWCGIVLMGIGETGNFAAYGFASVMLIAPLGSVAVIGWIIDWQRVNKKPDKNGSAVASVLFLKGSIRPEGILGGTVTVTGIFLLVTFAPHVTQEPTARQIQTDIVSWRFLIYVILEVIIFCILLYFYKRRQVKHIMLPLTMVALLASLSIICVKAVAAMIILSVKGNMQLTHPIFYIMLTIMVVTCVFQVKFLDEALQLYGTAEVIPMNYVFFTVSAVMAGAIFYQEFQAASPLSGFMFLFGCFLSFLGVFIITQNGGKDHLKSFYIDYGHIPGKKMSSKIQPDSHSLSYGSCCNEGDSVKAQSILNSS